MTDATPAARIVARYRAEIFLLVRDATAPADEVRVRWSARSRRWRCDQHGATRLPECQHARTAAALLLRERLIPTQTTPTKEGTS